MAIELDDDILAALIVGVIVIVGGLVWSMKLGKQQKKRHQLEQKAAKTPTKQRSKKTLVKSTPPSKSSKVTRLVANGTGSVRTPAGRRSARLARKSLEHND
eukprot:CAMPEP_0183739264 /NCGR_PEP_ID=MMETSP0737-20130205/56619_1 /TAXON_ID=385413 /ORGANISM="Thalassiosira miniscula, Strain CCMP1093" /LENGTH=100 /DNA_ID=CAMNT_0025974021 /DNA_START=22 /DNA_END=324 /DNA_ORIENTATION=+